VHEGPQSISPRTHVQEPLVDGMIVSDEPGYYEEGSFGVRIENLVRVKEASTQFNFAGKTFNCFETLTKIPYQAKMMDKRLLTEIELHWIDDYHQKVWDDLSPRLESNSRAMQWLSEHTQPIRAQLAAA
jgi:Xaa-Pro aminopeptidase